MLCHTHRHTCISISIAQQSLSYKLIRRICHAPRRKGDVTGRLWQGCHSAAISLLQAGESCRKLRLKSVDGREQVSLFPCAVLAPEFAKAPDLKLSFARSCTPSFTTSRAAVFARASCRSHTGFRTVTPYIQFSMFQVKEQKKSLH